MTEIMGLYQLGSNVLFLVVRHTLPSRGSKADPCGTYGTGSGCWPFSQHPLRADVRQRSTTRHTQHSQIACRFICVSDEHCKEWIREEGAGSGFCRVSSGENAVDGIRSIESSVVGRSRVRAELTKHGEFGDWGSMWGCNWDVCQCVSRYRCLLKLRVSYGQREPWSKSGGYESQCRVNSPFTHRPPAKRAVVGNAHGGDQDKWLSASYAQFDCDPKAALKHKVYYHYYY